MIFKPLRILMALSVVMLLCAANAQATNRWDVLRWCTTNTPAEIARCEGFLYAAVDLRTSPEFAGPKSCFEPQTRLVDIRLEVIDWLKGNRTAPQESGLALVSRAIGERFPCDGEYGS